jgi:hypothetical protein
MNKYKIDEDFGLENEIKSEDYIQLYFKQNTLIKLSKFNKFDYEGETAFFEIKTRRNLSTDYTTTMIGYTKILHAQKQNKDVYFIFQFTDGNYYYKYDISETFEIKKGGRYDRGRPENNLYYYIPIERLIKIE